MLKPLEVHDLRDQDHGRQRVNPAKTAQPSDRGAVGIRLGQRRDPFIQSGHPR
jgi:hypothetical protein